MAVVYKCHSKIFINHILKTITRSGVIHSDFDENLNIDLQCPINGYYTIYIDANYFFNIHFEVFCNPWNTLIPQNHIICKHLKYQALVNSKSVFNYTINSNSLPFY